MNKKKVCLNLLSSFLVSSAIVISIPTLTMSCGSNSSLQDQQKSKLRVSTFNISFAIDGDNTNNGGADYYERWNKYLSYSKQEQDKLINKWLINEPTSQKPFESKANVDTDEHLIAERIIQIRNIAASIQYNKPDIILLNEFNNDGVGKSNIMNLFQKNYLSWPQFIDGIEGKEKTEPINYPYIQEYETNTGELALDAEGKVMDLNNDNLVAQQANENISNGVDLNGNPITIYKGMIYYDNGFNSQLNKKIYSYAPDDTYGFGYYHGHYAFGVMSKYELDIKNQRTFKNFKLKDMPNSNQYRAVIDNRLGNNIYQDAVNKQILKEGDFWYNDNEWDNLRMSSKNHVDLPIKVKNDIIHLLISHPTPASFDKVSPSNILRNRAEVEFWKHYINNEQNIYDDSGKKGGIDGKNTKFVIMGDLNADTYIGSDDSSKRPLNTSIPFNEPIQYNSSVGIKDLTSNIYINKDIINYDAKFVPKSNGGFLFKNDGSSWAGIHPHPEIRTAYFGSRPDWVIPSYNLEIIESKVFWHSESEPAYKLFVDKRLGNKGESKEVSSDHRLVYVDIKI